jgi:hypothetical protein
MTKKDYILAATIIRNSGATKKARAILRDAFGDFFAADNPRFDRSRWNTAVDDGMIQQRPGATPRPIGG